MLNQNLLVCVIQFPLFIVKGLYLREKNEKWKISPGKHGEAGTEGH